MHELKLYRRNIRKKRRSGSLHLLLQMEFMVCWERMAQERQR